MENQAPCQKLRCVARSISEATCESISTSWMLHSPNQLTQDQVLTLTCAKWFSCSHHSFGNWMKTLPLWGNYENSRAFEKKKQNVGFLFLGKQGRGISLSFAFFEHLAPPYLLCMSCLWIYFVMWHKEHRMHCLVISISTFEVFLNTLLCHYTVPTKCLCQVSYWEKHMSPSEPKLLPNR